jgi:enoyl-CoA hydratase/carnithine racemase
MVELTSIGDLSIDVANECMTVTFNRPSEQNSLTWQMYDALARAMDYAEQREFEIRAFVLIGAGGRAFVAGTDISQFLKFETGDDGLQYERRVAEILDRIAAMRVPTIAAIDGYCVGAGLAIAAACDLRLATDVSMFGAPIARTVGNCLSAGTMSRLVEHFGKSRVMWMLLQAELFDAHEAFDIGFLGKVVSKDDFGSAVDHVVRVLADDAPLTVWATRETIRRLGPPQPDADSDVISRVYGSRDFREGARAFIEKRKPSWSGH